MTYGSVCSGIEAATVAWKPLGWKAAWFSEIEPFPCAVLKHHYPKTPNLGDMTRLHEKKEFRDGAIEILVGGTPCQSFSVAGLRKGMADPRGNLALVFLGVLDRARPRWVVWENVPGVLSVDGGRAFGAFVGGLAQLGYGLSWRVLDAQHFGVPQRRRRVFVVGYLGDWRRSAAVLFESHSLSGHPPPGREAGTGVAALTANGVGTCGADDNQAQAGHLVAGTLRGGNKAQGGSGITEDLALVAKTINAKAGTRCDPSQETMITHALRGEGFDASEDGTGRGTPLAICFESRFARNGRGAPEKVAPPLKAQSGGTGKGDAAPLVAFTIHGTNKTARTANETRVAGSLRTKPPGSIENSSTTVAMTGSHVRRLTPRECERLQGFPDDYTLIPYGGGAFQRRPALQSHRQLHGSARHALDRRAHQGGGRNMNLSMAAWQDDTRSVGLTSSQGHGACSGEGFLGVESPQAGAGPAHAH